MSTDQAYSWQAENRLDQSLRTRFSTYFNYIDDPTGKGTLTGHSLLNWLVQWGFVDRGCDNFTVTGLPPKQVFSLSVKFALRIVFVDRADFHVTGKSKLDCKNQVMKLVLNWIQIRLCNLSNMYRTQTALSKANYYAYEDINSEIQKVVESFQSAIRNETSLRKEIVDGLKEPSTLHFTFGAFILNGNTNENLAVFSRAVKSAAKHQPDVLTDGDVIMASRPTFFKTAEGIHRHLVWEIKVQDIDKVNKWNSIKHSDRQVDPTNYCFEAVAMIQYARDLKNSIVSQGGRVDPRTVFHVTMCSLEATDSGFTSIEIEKLNNMFNNVLSNFKRPIKYNWRGNIVLSEVGSKGKVAAMEKMV